MNDVTTMKNYSKHLAERAVTGRPAENIVYAVFIDSIAFHKEPFSRFAIHPQMSLAWNNKDRRKEVLDMGIGNFTLPGISPPFKLRCGVEATRAIQLMSSLPDPESIKDDHHVLAAFHKLYYQAEDQAKAAYKHDYPLSNNGVHWILLVGAYWVPVVLGPFTEAQSTGRAPKTSDSADFGDSINMADALEEGPFRAIQEIYLIGTTSSSARFEGILASTDDLAAPFINALWSVRTAPIWKLTDRPVIGGS